MALSLQQLTAAFKKQDTNESRPSNYYRFWDMNEGDSATIRFLPDANEANPLGFMVEKLTHYITINGEDQAVPCLKMYGEECPICKVSAAYYKDEGKGSLNGKKYWRKKQHIAQAIVVEDPQPANPETGETAEGKVKLFNLSYQLHNVIIEAFGSGDALDDIPYLFKGGTNFIIKKSQSGDGQAKYDVGSKFARRPSDLTPEEVELATAEMIDLATLLPKNPGLEKVEAMLEAALTGGTYVDSTSSDDSTSTPATSTPVKESVATKPIVETASAAPSKEFDDESQDILAMIRERKNKSAE